MSSVHKIVINFDKILRLNRKYRRKLRAANNPIFVLCAENIYPSRNFHRCYIPCHKEKKKSHFRVSTLSITGAFSEKHWRYETQRGSRVSARVKSLRPIIVHLVEWLSHLLVGKALTWEEGRNRFHVSFSRALYETREEVTICARLCNFNYIFTTITRFVKRALDRYARFAFKHFFIAVIIISEGKSHILVIHHSLLHGKNAFAKVLKNLA